MFMNGEWGGFSKDAVMTYLHAQSQRVLVGLRGTSKRATRRGSFQKFYTLYIFSLKMNLFYKIHLQAFNVISIVVYHSGPTFGQVLYSCQDAFVVDGLITRLTSLDTSSMLLKRFPRSGFFNFGNKSKAAGLMSGLYGGWGSTCHPYFSTISDTAPEA